MKPPARKTVLLVDLSPTSLASELERSGLSVLSADNVHAGFSIFCSQSIDIVIADAHMGDGSGLQLLARIKAFAKDKPVILLVGPDTKKSILDLQDLGANAALLAGTPPNQIVEQIYRVLNSNFENWSIRSIRIPVELNVELEIITTGQIINTRTVNIGRGGFFAVIRPTDIPDTGTLLSFELQIQKPKFTTVRGEGIVRWIRKEKSADKSTGAGIEFIVLDDQSRSDVIELTESLRFKKS